MLTQQAHTNEHDESLEGFRRCETTYCLKLTNFFFFSAADKPRCEPLYTIPASAVPVMFGF